MMHIWLAKADPKTYSIDDLEKDGTAVWKKVRHPKAMQHMSQMEKGDKLLIYHSGEKEIKGVAEVLENLPDPDHSRGRLVKVSFVKRFALPLVTLKDVKSSGKFDDWGLVREPRLSVMPVSREFMDYFKLDL